LQQIGRSGQGTLLVLIATIDKWNVVGAVEAAHMADDLAMARPSWSPIGMTRARSNLLGLMCR
jgi:hypothetical protein